MCASYAIHVTRPPVAKRQKCYKQCSHCHSCGMPEKPTVVDKKVASCRCLCTYPKPYAEHMYVHICNFLAGGCTSVWVDRKKRFAVTRLTHHSCEGRQRWWQTPRKPLPALHNIGMQLHVSNYSCSRGTVQSVLLYTKIAAMWTLMGMVNGCQQVFVSLLHCTGHTDEFLRASCKGGCCLACH